MPAVFQPHSDEVLQATTKLKQVKSKINKLRKSYEGKVKALGLDGRNKAQSNQKELEGLADAGWSLMSPEGRTLWDELVLRYQAEDRTVRLHRNVEVIEGCGRARQACDGQREQRRRGSKQSAQHGTVPRRDSPIASPASIRANRCEGKMSPRQHSAHDTGVKRSVLCSEILRSLSPILNIA